MQPPVRISEKKSRCWSLPDREWLYYEYIILKKSAFQLGEEVGISPLMIRKWLARLEIPKRTLIEVQVLRRRVDYEVCGKLKYRRRQARKIMIAANIPRQCVKCGQTEGKLEVDHIDQNPCNNAIENLRYLCIPCHRAEPLRYSDGWN